MPEPSPIPLPSARSYVFDPPELGLPDEKRPLCRLQYPDGRPGWLVTDYSLAKAVLMDRRFGAPAMTDVPVGDPDRIAVIAAAMNEAGFPSFLGLDPPEHSRLKRMVASHFSAGSIAALEPRLEEIVDIQLDSMEAAGPPADLVQAFAAPVSLATQCELLGISADDARRFYRLGTSVNDPALSIEDVADAWRECGDYVRALVERKRRQDGEVIAEIARRGDLSTAEAAGIVILLILGGLETTGDMLALGTFILLSHPDQLASLRAAPSLAESAVEELLRYSGIFRVVLRTALEDVELDDQMIAKGDRVSVSLAAANRDPEKFSCPQELDLSRGAHEHLAFGKGIHMCLGQRLARLELRVGLGRLLDRFPELRLNVPPAEVVTYGDDQLNYGLRELPVAW